MFAQTTTEQQTSTSNQTNFSSQSDFSRWQVRLRGLWVVPDISSTTLPTVGAKATNVSNSLIPELDINYFFTPHISTELILGTTKNSVTGTGNLDLGSVWLLPPTLTLLYHFTPNSLISPYLGAGINYTVFYGAKSGAVDSIKYDNAFCVAFQAGMDINISKQWSINFDVKKIFLNTDVHITAAPGENSETLNVKINPWIFGAGVGYKFQ